MMSAWSLTRKELSSMEALVIPALLLVGCLLAVQAAANVQLSSAMQSPVAASTLQLGVAAGLLLGVAAAAGVLGALAALDTAEPWSLVGGLGSAVYITAGIVLFPRLGALMTVGLFITGQMLASLALDAFGWLGVTEVGLDPLGVLGALVVVTGAGLIVQAQTGSRSVGAAVGGRQAWISLALIGGAALPVQGAINARLRAELDAALAVAAFSFIVATLAMAIVLAGILARGAAIPRGGPLARMPWWGWLGGLCGAIYVTTVFLAIPHVGAAPVTALTVAGQQAVSVAVDRYGLLRLPRRPISGRRLVGVGVLLTGVALITLR
jgi:transporter family-2 protein